MSINAFVGHSFAKKDAELVRKFLVFFDNVSKMGIDFKWEHAEEAEPKELSIKVIEKMEGKNLFIGICTPRQRSIDINQIHSFSLIPNYLWSNKTNFETKTSDWILQEIGFSVGRKMDIILLVENGVVIPRGIHGNIEYIPFEHNNPEESFNKILEMLNSLAKLPTSAATTGPSKTKEAIKETETTSTVPITENTNLTEWTLDDYGLSLSHSVIDDDNEQEEDVNNKFLDSQFAADQFTVARWNAFRAYLKIVWKKENRLDELLTILEENPENHYVIRYVARAYETLNEYRIAATYFEKSSVVSEDSDQKLRDLSKASLAYIKSGAKNLVLSLINSCIVLAREDEKLTVTLLETLSDVLKELGDSDNYKIFTEALLERSPDDSLRRFSLAFKYSEDSENDGALFHYRFLSTRSPDRSNWNNLGVALSNLKLPSLSVDAYKEAEKLGETLSMSNLAHKYISEGFLEDAINLTNKAISMENYDKAIGSAISSIKETREKEIKEEEKLTESHNKRRRFYIDYSAQYVKENIQSLPKKWRGSRCGLELTIHKDAVELFGEFDTPKSLPSILPVSKEPPVKNYIKYIGTINGSTIKFNYWISKEKMPQTESDKPSGSGLMIVEDNNQKIRVYEKGLRDDAAFTEITVIEEDQQS